MPHTEDFTSTPPTSQDEGYVHGVSIDSMIVTPRIPTLVEQVGVARDPTEQQQVQNFKSGCNNDGLNGIQHRKEF